MKKPRLHILVLATCIFAAFLAGFFAGRNLNRTPVQIQNLSAATPVSGSATREEPSDPIADATQAALETEVEAVGIININTATSEQLQTLPGIGPTYAQRIIDYREEHGPFRTVGELMNISGIGEKRLEAIWDLVTTGG